MEFPFVRVKSISSGKGFLAFFTGRWQMAGCHVSFQGGAEKNKNRPELELNYFYSINVRLSETLLTYEDKTSHRPHRIVPYQRGF